MSATLTTTPTAGWYPDPGHSGAWRWWDGETWTEHVRAMEHTEPVAVVSQPVSEPIAQPVPEPVLEPAPATAPAQLTPATPASEQLYWHSPNAEVVTVPGRKATSHHSDAHGTSAGAAAHRPRIWGEVGSPQTVGIWLLASLPLLGIALQVVLGIAFGVVQGTTGAVTNIPNLVFSVAFLIMAWVFAGLDIKSLRERGYEPPSIAWMLLLPPLAYFIQRGKVVRREGKRAWPPELLYFLSVIGILGLTIVSVVFIITMMGGIDGLTALAGSGAV